MIYNGIDICDVDHAISVNKEIPPGAPPVDIQMMDGQHGAIYTGMRTAPAEYIVRVNIACKVRDDAWRVRNKLALWACVGRTAKLIPTHWPCVSYDAICQSISPPEFHFGFGVVEVSFLIPRPFAASLALSRAVLPGGGLYEFGGDIPAKPTISQTIEAKADSIDISMDGVLFFRLIGTFEAGSTYAIDFAAQTIMYNGQHAEALVDYTVSKWEPGFGPGGRAITSSDKGPLAIAWRNEWM